MEILERKLFRRYKAGYELWDELHAPVKWEADVISDPDGGAEELASIVNESDPEPIWIRAAYTPEGHYIGNSRIAHSLCKKRSIRPEPLPGSKVCSIGFCDREQKWYGWSHRAIFGFAIGDVVKDGDCTASSGWTDEYLAEHTEDDLSRPVGFQAKTLADAKRMAIAFADSVS